MRLYRERLGVPTSWWLVTLACAALLGTPLWAGLSIAFAIAIYAILGAVCAVVLHLWGAATIEVTDTVMRAGSQVLPLSAVGEVAAMDAAQTRALRGPEANPAAYLLIRPYLPESVYVEVAGRPQQRPYWLIGTRSPSGLAAAIEDARRRGDGDRTWDDAHGDHAPKPGRSRRIEAARSRRGSNAR